MSRSPYKLFDYYTFEDRDLFYGREEEGQRTVGEVLSSRLKPGCAESAIVNGLLDLIESSRKGE